MGKIMAEVIKNMSSEIKSIEDLFVAVYYYLPLSARWQWESVLNDVLAEAVEEGKITSEQSEEIRKAVIDEYYKLLEEELEEGIYK